VNITHIDELEAIEQTDGFVWRPVRRHFGIRAFGTNAYTPGASGQVVEEHTERRYHHQEMYLVLRGRLRFTVDGDEHELEPGQLVFVRDPSVRRSAVALTDDAAVLAIGGKPGAPHEISAWEEEFLALHHLRAGRYDEAERLLQQALDANPGHGSVLYNLACVEALGGRHEAAIEHLSAAITAEPELVELAQTDEDFASIRGDPRFPASTASHPSRAEGDQS
jgi:tetratricopeptide (TPR) repeat protein